MNHPWPLLAILCSACGPDTIVPDDTDDTDGETGDEFDPVVECTPIVQVESAPHTPGRGSCALAASGRVRCWGTWGDAEIGDDEPAWQASWLDDTVGSLAVGYDVCGAGTDGTLACFGVGSDLFDTEMPLVESGLDLGAPIVAMSVGYLNGCAIVEGGTVRCWGQIGVLGVETDPEEPYVGDDEEPTSVLLPSPAVDIAVGHSTACVVIEGGDVGCWGWDYCDFDTGVPCGMLGIPGTVQSMTPVWLDLPAPAVGVSVGSSTSCAWFEDGSFTYWGWETVVGRGDGFGNVGDDETPASLPPLAFDEPVVQIDVGQFAACARLASGSVQCWGGSSIATPITPSGWQLDPFVVEPIPLPEPAVHITNGFGSACALGQSGEVYCWGAPADGALGYGHSDVIGVDPSITEVQPVPVLDPRCE